MHNRSTNVVEKFFESKKNANCLLDLESDLLSNDEETVLKSLNDTEEIFVKVFEEDMLQPHVDSGESQLKFKNWLTERYEGFVLHLISYLCHQNECISEKSLHVLMKLVTLEGKKPLKNIPKGIWFFPKELFKKIVGELASSNIDYTELIVKFQDYLEKDDIKMYTLKSILCFLDQSEVTDIFLINIFTLLTNLKYPEIFCSEETAAETSSILLSQEGLTSPFYLKEKMFCKLFSTVWLRFLKHSLPLPLLKKTLLIAHKKFIPHLQNPCLVTDFLTDAYNHGGIISLLALNGLFILMQKYNVEYPNFFLKLYSLFDETIMNCKFHARFFYLSDLFLSSTHLPAYLVAAFAKKLSRIALSSKTECQLKIIPFVCNLLTRHPTLSTLVHKTEPSEITKDPFVFEAKDPAECNALDSSLWEIKSLQSHINPTVSRKAKLINCGIPKTESDLSNYLDLSADELYRKERKRKFTAAPTAVDRPQKETKWCSFSR